MQILLDIDGVMVPANSWKRPDIHPDGFPMFSDRATKALQKILVETAAEVVLTSSHKATYTHDAWKQMFEARGISVHKIERLPKTGLNTLRKDELMTWFSSPEHDPNFIIIDDDKSLNDLPFELKKRLILTNGSVGLTEGLADEAIALLKKSVKFRIF